MASVLVYRPVLGVRLLALDASNPGQWPINGSPVGRQRLPTEPVGTATVTFTGVQSGSEIRIVKSDNTEVAGIENCAADQMLSWPAYPTGNSNNVVTVRIVHMSYKIKEFGYTTLLGAQTLPIQQEPDKWWNNPA